jgi:hypothetical protein
MARESALWVRIKKTGIKTLVNSGYAVHLTRIENAVGTGHPDVEGCINGGQTWIELKSEMRPKRIDTPVHLKAWRESQSVWHKGRTDAGSRIHWVLIQVGEDNDALLYLIPGMYYDRVKALAEVELKALSVVPPKASISDVLIRAAQPW